MDKQQDKDPYLSELDAIDDFEGQPAEEATEIDGPTRLDVKAVKAVKAAPVPKPQMPPPPSFDEGSPESPEAEDLPPLDDFSLPQETAESPSEPSDSLKVLLDLSPDLAVPLLVVMGRKSFTVQDLLELKLGQVMDLDREPLEPVDLVAGGRVIGKGELVEVDGKIGVRVLKLFK